MKALFLLLATIFFLSNSAKAFDQWCAQSPEINYRATLAVDNLEFLEEDVRFYHSRRRRLINEIQGLRGFLNNLISITDSEYSNCRNIQSHFYRVDFRLRDLTRRMNRRLLDRQNSPVQSSWDTFVRSFIELETAVLSAEDNYRAPRGPIYRRYFPSYRRYFPVRRGRVIYRWDNSRGSSTVVIRRGGRRSRYSDRLDRRERRLDRRERRINRRERRERRLDRRERRLDRRERRERRNDRRSDRSRRSERSRGNRS